MENNILILLEFLRADGSIVINKKMARAIGINATIIYSELISKYLYFSDKEELNREGYFFNTVEDLEKDTCLSRDPQLEAIKKLMKLKLIDKKIKGVPPKRYFKILTNKGAFDTLKVLLLKGASNCQKNGQLIVRKTDNPINNTKANNTKSKQEPPAKNESLRKELKSLNFNDQEIGDLLVSNTSDQIGEKLRILKSRQGIRNPKLYFIKILKEDYPSKDMPVISDNGNNGDHSEDTNILRWKPVKDSLTLQERKRVRERIAKKAGEAAKKLRRGILV
ncbi:hypothetical protein ES702_00352 [subsurface metagenome]